MSISKKHPAHNSGQMISTSVDGGCGYPYVYTHMGTQRLKTNGPKAFECPCVIHG
jgi:hypothetical protein